MKTITTSLFAVLVAGAIAERGASTRRLSLVAPNSRPRCTSQGCGPSVASAPVVVVQRDTVTTVVRETSCPDGMSLEGSVCVGLDICPVQYTCPRGFVETDLGDCATESQPTVECPGRYTLHGGKACTRGTVTQANYICEQPGYFLDGASKVCVKEVPQPPTCPAGYVMEGSSCVQKYSPQLRCGPGQTFSPHSKDCVSTFTEPATLSCPDGSMEADGERCVSLRQDPAYCLPGFTMEGSSCVQTVQRVCGECPAGYNRNGRGCERVERSPAQPGCPATDAYELRGEVCVKETPQESRCPAGTQKSAFIPDTCEKCVAPKPVCKEGTLKGGQCVVEIEQPSKECCAAGYKLEGSQCVRVEVTPPKLSCEGECYISHSSPVAYACPVESEFVADPVRPKCVRQTRETVCAPPEPQQCSAEAATRGLCSVQTPPQPQCNELLASDIVAAEPYCPDGGALEDGRCVAREPIVPERKCQVGTLDEETGMCTRTTTSPLQFDCPAGSTRRGKRCVTQEIRDASYVCPEESEETAAGVCTVRTHATPVPNKVEKIPVTYTCSEGSVLSGKQCLFSSTADLPLVCPAGSQDTGAGCVKITSPIVPPAVETTHRPNYLCSYPGAKLSGRQCSITERNPAEPYCANDSFLQYNQCIRSVPVTENPCKTLTASPRPVCESPTAELRGCVCLEHEETEPLVSCASGFELNAQNKCERRTSKTPLCPTGTELQGDGCVRRIEVAPTVKIINGCEVGVAKQPVCHTGY